MEQMMEAGSAEKTKQRILKILTACYLIPLSAVLLFNAGNSLLRTTYFDLYDDMNTARYRWDHPLAVLAVAVLILAILLLVSRTKWFRDGKQNHFAWIFAGVGCLFSLVIVLLVQGTAICDGGTISSIVVQFMRDDYSAFQQGEYMYNYSFQIGFAALLELIYRIFGMENYLAYQIFNCIAVGVILLCLNRITGMLFTERAQKLEALLSIGMLPLFFYAIYVYGDEIGLAFGIAGAERVLTYLKKEQPKALIPAAIYFACGMEVKSNVAIMVVAAGIAVILYAVSKKRFRDLLFLLLFALLPALLTSGVKTLYAQRAGLTEYPEGIPKVAWMAMSFQETDEGGIACGWYNGYNWSVYASNGYDAEQTQAACMENLKSSFEKMAHEQRYALDFLYKKFTSQWNAPDCQSMIDAEWSTRHSQHTTALAHWLLYDTGREMILFFMNGYHFLLFFLAGIWALTLRKHWSQEAAYFALNIFGGLLFHMIWEAMARYILAYYVMLLPLAACGAEEVYTHVKRRMQKVKVQE